MKVLIFPGFGGCHYTDEMVKAIENETEFIKQRIGKVVEVVEKAEIRDATGLTQYDWDKIINELSKKQGTIVGLKGMDKNNTEDINYYTWYKETSWIMEMKIVDVDTSKPWKIGEYDGAEGIEYFNEPEILDKETNYARW